MPFHLLFRAVLFFILIRKKKVLAFCTTSTGGGWGCTCLFCCCRLCRPLGSDHYKSSATRRPRTRVFSPPPPINYVYTHASVRKTTLKQLPDGCSANSVGETGEAAVNYRDASLGPGISGAKAYARGVIEHHKSATTTTADLTGLENSSSNCVVFSFYTPTHEWH